MNLPRELKLEVVAYLEKGDLKAVRLVNRDLKHVVAPFLFDKIHWSSQDSDREVFDHIVDDAALASHVKILEIDQSVFYPNLSRERYFEDLCSQIKTLVVLIKGDDVSI